MADTIREYIILNALAQAAKIMVVNGYNYTMSTPLRAVKYVDPASLPISIIFPGTEESECRFGKEILTFQIRVESHATLAANASVIQEKMLGDLRKNFTNPADVWSTYIDEVSYLEGGPADQPGAEDLTTAVYAIFQVKYKTNIGNPYLNT